MLSIIIKWGTTLCPWSVRPSAYILKLSDMLSMCIWNPVVVFVVGKYFKALEHDSGIGMG